MLRGLARLRHCMAVVLLSVTVVRSQSLADLRVPIPMPPGGTLVIGFLGAWERWDDENRGVRKLARKLRSHAIPNLYVETLSNHKRGTALELIRRAFDTNRDGAIDNTERSALRIVLYGQSLGGLAVVKLARELEALHAPVLLTIQIDSVGLTDVTIPANVAAAANLHQQSSFSLRGQDVIRAADPSRTRIIENKQYFYNVPPRGGPETWPRRKLGGGHAQMEADPAVWAHVERLILDALETLQ